MKLTPRDLQKLALPAAIALALCIAASLLAWGAQNDARNAEIDRQRAAEAKTRSEMQLRQFHSEELDLTTRLQTLQSLQTSGVLGEERRLDWMEQLRNTQRELHLPGLKYEFAAQSPLNTAPQTGPNWYTSPLRLQLHLLHEGDLLNLLNRIEQEARALVILRSCKLAPPTAQGENRNAPATLPAECEMDWLTVRLPGGGK